MNAHFFNRRLFFRRAINEPAWIERSSNNILERCTLVNLCEVGARLTISDVYDLPEKFALHLTRGSNLGRQCRVIWQRDHEVGVEFLSKAPLAHTTVSEVAQENAGTSSTDLNARLDHRAAPNRPTASLSFSSLTWTRSRRGAIRALWTWRTPSAASTPSFASMPWEGVTE
jgi:PilZ domain